MYKNFVTSSINEKTSRMSNFFQPEEKYLHVPLSYLSHSVMELEVLKVENILTGNLDSVPSPSPSVKIQIIGRKVYLS